MTATPLSKPQIRGIALVVLLMWSIGHAAILYFDQGFAWQIALTDSVLTNVILAITCAAVSNMLSYYLPAQQKAYYVLLIALVLSLIVTLLTQWILSSLVFAHNKAYINFLDTAIWIKFALAFICLLWCGVANALWYKVAEQSEISERMLITQNLAKEAELNKLRHQLQPHFLFNSLNSVYALTITNASEAGNMIMKLSTFLRGTLKRDDEVWVSLAEEMEYIQLYLDIEKVRFSHRLSVAINIAEEAKAMQLPGTFLQPIVENAIKFGLYNTAREITISLDVSTTAQGLCIEVRNPFDPEMKSTEGTGFGLSAIRRRLYLLFADSQLLQTRTEENNLYITTLIIPQKNG